MPLAEVVAVVEAEHDERLKGPVVAGEGREEADKTRQEVKGSSRRCGSPGYGCPAMPVSLEAEMTVHQGLSRQ